jgi:transcriptional regulator with XRE-family HTH domain
MPFTLVDLGRNIKRLREARVSLIKPGKPMLQYELADKAGIPASCLSNIEKGKYRNPTWNILLKIASALDCDISAFFLPDERPVSPSQIALTEMIEMIVREKLENILKEPRK